MLPASGLQPHPAVSVFVFRDLEKGPFWDQRGRRLSALQIPKSMGRRPGRLFNLSNDDRGILVQAQTREGTNVQVLDEKMQPLRGLRNSETGADGSRVTQSILTATTISHGAHRFALTLRYADDAWSTIATFTRTERVSGDDVQPYFGRESRVSSGPLSGGIPSVGRAFELILQVPSAARDQDIRIVGYDSHHRLRTASDDKVTLGSRTGFLVSLDNGLVRIFELQRRPYKTIKIPSIPSDPKR